MKTDELIGANLDNAVAVTQGFIQKELSMSLSWMIGSGKYKGAFQGSVANYNPSEDWETGGPIIEKNFIAISPIGLPNVWEASMAKGGKEYYSTGNSPLLAAMRCFIKSKYGETVDVIEIVKFVTN